jgi:hypothetical protein
MDLVNWFPKKGSLEPEGSVLIPEQSDFMLSLHKAF